LGPRDPRHLVFGEVFEPHDAPVAALEPAVVTFMISELSDSFISFAPKTVLAAVPVSFYIPITLLG